MPRLEVSLNIGLCGAEQEDVIDIDQEDWDACETKAQQQELIHEYWWCWASEHVDGRYVLLEDEDCG